WVAALVPDDLKQVLGDLAGNDTFLDQVDDRAELLRRNRRFVDVEAGLVERAEKVVDDPVGSSLAVATGRNLLVIVGNRLFRNENRRVVGRQPERVDQTALLGVRQLRQFLAERVDIGLVEFQRQQIGIGEVAIV